MFGLVLLGRECLSFAWKARGKVEVVVGPGLRVAFAMLCGQVSPSKNKRRDGWLALVLEAGSRDEHGTTLLRIGGRISSFGNAAAVANPMHGFGAPTIERGAAFRW